MTARTVNAVGYLLFALSVALIAAGILLPPSLLSVLGILGPFLLLPAGWCIAWTPSGKSKREDDK